MAKSATSSTTDRATKYALAVVAGEIVAGPHVRNACQRHLDDLENGEKRGIRFDEEIAARALRFFEQKLKLSEGQFEGLSFEAHPSQAFIIGSLFGWQRESKDFGWVRRFRRAYIEQGKGNGKSPLAGGIGLYGLIADKEPGAEIYAAGATKDQAGILFRDAVKMRAQSPFIRDRTKPSGGEGKEYNLAYLAKGSFFRPISREAKRTGSGPRPHMALCDEVHEHPDRGVMEMLERGFKFRRQPLLLMITNSGSDRNSICWEEHDHAVKVAAGNLNARSDDAFYLGETIDDSTFSYVCALDSERTFSSFNAVRYMQTSCTCHSVQTTQIDRLTAEVFAGLATSVGGGWKVASAALTTQAGRSLSRASATSAMGSGQSSGRQKSGPSAENTRSGGTKKTSSACENTSDSGTQSAPAIESEKLRSRISENTVWETLSSTLLLLRRMDDAASAARKNASASTTVTIPGNSGDFSVSSATLQSAFLGIIQKLYNAHSPTCCVRKAKHKDGSLKVPGDNPLDDPTCWAKANPLLGVTITEEYLAGVVAQAKAMPGKLNGILRLHFCTWTDAETAWMTRASLDPCIVDFEPLDEHQGKPVWLGADLSQVKDITALAYCAQSGVVKIGEHAGKPVYDAWVQAWTPGDTLAARALVDGLPYENWVREGHLNAPKGQSINYRHVAQALAEAQHDFDIQCLAYDRYAFSRMLEPEMRELGLDMECVEHPQGGTKKGKPTDAMKEAAKAAGREPEGLWMPMSVRQVEELILEGRLRIQRNPLTISAMMSAVTDEDRWNNYWLAKERAVNKIDAAVALCMSVGAALAYEGSSTSVDDWLAGLAA